MKLKRFILSAMVGTLILFAWNMVSWLVLPFHSNSLRNIPDSALDVMVLKEHLKEDGVYHYPGLPEDSSSESWAVMEEKVKTGPRITLMVYKSGETSLFSPISFLVGLVFNSLSVLLLMFILSNMSNRGRWRVVTVSIAVGLFVSFIKDFPQMVWYLFPLPYTLVEVADTLVATLLLGLFLGHFLFNEKNRAIRS